MRRSRVAVLGGALLVMAAGCGGGEPACGPGTLLAGGVCVPNGSIVCVDGTVYDAEAGGCVVDPSGCGRGTVLVGGQCRDPADVEPDVREPPEPNGLGPGHIPGGFTLAGVGGHVTLGGCIEPILAQTPMGEDEPDLDVFRFEVSAPTLIEITVDGYGGLAGGFLVTAEHPALIANGWSRYGASLLNDLSRRQLYLPAAGTYDLIITDSRTLLIDGHPAVGDGGTCYLATVETLAAPAAQAITTTATGALGGHSHVYRHAPAEGDLLFFTVTAPSATALVDLVIMRNGQYVSSSPGRPARALGDSVEAVAGDLRQGDELVLVAEAVLDYGVQPARFNLEVFSPRPVRLPADGSAVTVPSHGHSAPHSPIPSWAYFDAGAGELVRLGLAAPAGVTAALFTADLALVAVLCAPACTSYEGHLHLAAAGRYYLYLVDQRTPQPPAFELSAIRDHARPALLAPGSIVDGAALDATGRDFHALAPDALSWWTVSGEPGAGVHGALELALYDRALAGQPGQELTALHTFPLTPGVEIGRIFNATPLLVEIRDTSFLDSTPGTYNLRVAERPHEALGTVPTGATLERAAQSLDAGATHYYLAHGTPGDLLGIAVTGHHTFDAVLRTFDAREDGEITNETGSGEEERLLAYVGEQTGWVAFSVTEAGAQAGTYDLRITGTPAATYTAAPGALPFASVCPDDGGDGERHALLADGGPWGADDDGLSAAPLDLTATGFRFYSAPATELTVSSNGWLTFTPGYQGDSAFRHRALPGTEPPSALIAPLWTDLDRVIVCTLVNTERVVVQWRGNQIQSGADAEMQVVLHPASQTIDILYGPGHAATGASATIGVENAAGTVATMVSHDTGGSAQPGTSWTFTPAH